MHFYYMVTEKRANELQFASSILQSRDITVVPPKLATNILPVFSIFQGSWPYCWQATVHTQIGQKRQHAILLSRKEYPRVHLSLVLLGVVVKLLLESWTEIAPVGDVLLEHSTMAASLWSTSELSSSSSITSYSMGGLNLLWKLGQTSMPSQNFYCLGTKLEFY
jgi:hypothetical protein